MVYDDKTIHFGAEKGQTYLDHENENKLEAWQKRCSKFYNKNGLAYKDKTSAEYWNWNLTWSKL